MVVASFSSEKGIAAEPAYETATLLALDEMHATCDGLELAVPAALRLGSELRYNEACEIYQQAQLKWPNDGKVKNLAKLFQEREAI